MDAVLIENILKKIKPTKEEEARVNAFVKRILKTAKAVSGLECIVCGSIGKNTWLHDDHDVDVFIMFSKLASRETLERKGLEFGRQITQEFGGTFKIKYAEHPYVHARINGFDVDIVPCYKISHGENIKSAVDRSPLHMDYITKNITPELRDEARLLKQFCKGVGVYGSDTKHLGLSGYICELLVMKYHSFKNVIKEITSWSAPQVIDLEGQTNRKFVNQPLIVIDPIDIDRNAAANFSTENFVKLINAAKRFVEKSSEVFFFPKPPKPISYKEISVLKSRGTYFVLIEMKKSDLIEDVLYPQLRRTMKRLRSILEYYKFYPMRCYEYVGKKALLLLELEIWSLPNVKKMVGPSLFSHKHSNEFLEKYKTVNPYIEDITWVADKKREFTNSTDLFRTLFKKSVEDLEKGGIPRNIGRMMRKARLIEDKKFWIYVKKNKSFSAFLKQKYFEPL